MSAWYASCVNEMEISTKKWEVAKVSRQDESCHQLEVELLMTENKQLRAQVALLIHEKDTALAMWRNERKKCQVAPPPAQYRQPQTYLPTLAAGRPWLVC
jgi:hypothetical protein